MVKDGLVTVLVTFRPSATPRVNSLLPAPRSPYRSSTSPAWRDCAS